MTPARLVLLGAATWLLVGSSTYGSISDPTLSRLVDSADLIVVGTAEFVRTSSRFLASLIFVLVLHVVLMACAIRYGMKHQWVRMTLSATAFVALLLLSLPVAPFFPTSGRYRMKAIVRVEDVMKGGPYTDVITVMYDTGFVCDSTNLVPRQEYLLFLRQEGTTYTVSWYDWSQWEYDGNAVQTQRREASGMGHIALAVMQQAVQSPDPDKIGAPGAFTGAR
jgi:hypothetical protein